MMKLIGFLHRIFRGEDVVLVSQTQDHWDRQFADGKWARLQYGQPNTAEVARLVLGHADAEGGRTITVLDVGCGNGGLARLIAGEIGIRYTGIDISESAIISAREVAPQGIFLVGDASTVSSAKLGTFDVIVFNEVFYYLDPKTVLPQYRTCADVDTCVCISVVRSWRSWFVWRRIRRFVRISKFMTITGDDKNRWDIATGTFI